MALKATPGSSPTNVAGFGPLRTAAVRGTRFAYREVGAGEPVVFVHGSASDLRTWESQLPELARSQRAIAYSRRYARPNADIAPDSDDQMQPHVEDLADFLEAIDAAPAHLVGHSWGGFVCLLAAIQRPDLVRTLVLEEPPVLSLFVSTPPRPTELLALLVRHPATALAIIRFGAGTMAPAQRAFRRGDDEAAIRRFALGVLGRESYEALSEERKRQMRENVAALRAGLLGAGFPPLAAEDVRGVEAPVLLLTGGSSRGLFRRLSGHLHELLPDSTRVEIPGASHRAHEERPADVAEAILAFIGRRARASL